MLTMVHSTLVEQACQENDEHCSAFDKATSKRRQIESEYCHPGSENAENGFPDFKRSGNHALGGSIAQRPQTHGTAHQMARINAIAKRVPRDKNIPRPSAYLHVLQESQDGRADMD
jgi:hypothetical protein